MFFRLSYNKFYDKKLHERALEKQIFHEYYVHIYVCKNVHSKSLT